MFAFIPTEAGGIPHELDTPLPAPFCPCVMSLPATAQIAAVAVSSAVIVSSLRASRGL